MIEWASVSWAGYLRPPGRGSLRAAADAGRVRKETKDMSEQIKTSWKGFSLMSCDCGALLAAGQVFPIVGGAVIAILAGMVITLFIKDKSAFEAGVKFTSKKILQWAVILLGFGMNLTVILETGRQSLPIIVSTIATSLIIAYVLHRLMHIPGRISTLVGVGSSICGGSAIAATAPVIDADDEEVAQSISVIFFFNVIAALLFPVLGSVLGFSHDTGRLSEFSPDGGKRYLLRDGDGLHLGQYVGPGISDIGYSGNGQADQNAGHHSDHAGAGFHSDEKGEAAGGRQKGGSETDFPDVHPVLRAGFRDYHGGVCGFRRGNGGLWGGGERVLFLEGREQVLHRSCHGGYRPEYGHCEAGKNRRQTDCHGILLLGRHHGGQPADAACTGHLVISARGRKQRSAWEYGIHCDVYRYPRRFFCFPGNDSPFAK